MRLPKYAIGLVSILTAVILVRVEVHFAHPSPGMAPEQIWRGMTAALKAVVLAGALLLGYGSWTLIRAALDRLARKNRDASPPVPDNTTAWSRFESGHPVAWAFLMGAGLLAMVGLGLVRSLVELGGEPTTPGGQGYLVGTMLGPLIMAGIAVGIYYAVRKNRRAPRRFVSALLGWTLLFAVLGLAGAAGRAPHFPKNDQEMRRMMNQAYKEASGAVPPDQYSKDEMAGIMRDMFRDVIQFNQQYHEAATRFGTPEMSHLYSAASFRNRSTIQETVRQLGSMASVEQQFASLDPVMAKMEARIQQTHWPEQEKRNFVRGMQESMEPINQSRLTTYQAEQKWIDASVDLYTFALNNASAISVRGNQVLIGDPATRETFNEKLGRAEELRRELRASSKQDDQERASKLKTYGLSPGDLGAK